MKSSSPISGLVKNQMSKLIGNDVVEVPIRKRGRTSEGVEGGCHATVDEWVQKIGGKRVPGWMLVESVRLRKHGVYHWTFHSVWETPEGKWVHVNEGTNHDHIQNIHFCPDKNRDLGFDDNYINLVFLRDKRAVRKYKKVYKMFTGNVTNPGFYWGGEVVPLLPFGESNGELKRFFDYKNDFSFIDSSGELLKESYGIDYVVTDWDEVNFGWPQEFLNNLTLETFTKLLHEFQFDKDLVEEVLIMTLYKNGELANERGQFVLR